MGIKFGKSGNIGIKKGLLLGLCGLLGIALIVLGNTGKNGFGANESNDLPASRSVADMEQYRKDLEGQITALCERVAGVEKAKVSISLVCGYTEVYATETDAQKSEYVILGSGSNAAGLYLSTRPPEIAGIGIVCNTGDSETVRSELLALVSAAYRMPTNRIYITEGK